MFVDNFTAIDSVTNNIPTAKNENKNKIQGKRRNPTRYSDKYVAQPSNATASTRSVRSLKRQRYGESSDGSDESKNHRSKRLKKQRSTQIVSESMDNEEVMVLGAKNGRNCSKICVQNTVPCDYYYLTLIACNSIKLCSTAHDFVRFRTILCPYSDVCVH